MIEIYIEKAQLNRYREIQIYGFNCVPQPQIHMLKP